MALCGSLKPFNARRSPLAMNETPWQGVQRRSEWLQRIGELPDLEQLQQEMAPRPALYPTVTVVLPELASYDLLLAAA